MELNKEETSLLFLFNAKIKIGVRLKPTAFTGTTVVRLQLRTLVGTATVRSSVPVNFAQAGTDF